MKPDAELSVWGSVQLQLVTPEGVQAVPAELLAAAQAAIAALDVNLHDLKVKAEPVPAEIAQEAGSGQAAGGAEKGTGKKDGPAEERNEL